MISLFAPSFIGLLLIASTHLFGRRLVASKFGGWLLDSSAGIAVAYAFVDVFPHVAKAQEKLSVFFVAGPFAYLEHHAYLVALLGFIFYLGLSKSLDEMRDPDVAPEDERLSPQLLILVAFMLLYNFLIGHMMAEQPTHRFEPALFFGLAMTAHLVGLKHEHRSNHPYLFDRWFRYLYLAGLAAGWITGLFLEMQDVTFGLWFAFLAGGIVSSGASTELPRIKSLPSFFTFCAGAALFTALILVVEAVRT